MIIQIRGTSGSGKTTAMRKLIQELGINQPVYCDGRRNPLFYTTHRESGLSIAVLGSYESTCGGCDTIHGYELLLSTVERVRKDYHVLMEGLLLSEDVKNTMTLPLGELRVIFLNTPLDVCLERVRQRRAEKGNDKPLNTANTSNRVNTIARARGRLEAGGVFCRGASPDQTPRLIKSWLKEGA